MDSIPIFVYALVISFVVLISYLTFLLGRRIKNSILYYLTTSFEITGPMNPKKGGLYGNIGTWLAKVAPEFPHQAIQSNTVWDEDGRITTTFKQIPGFEYPNHYFKYNKTWIQVKVRRIPELVLDVPQETITLTTWSWNKKILEGIREELRDMFKREDSDEGRTRFYIALRGRWMEFGFGKRKRPLSSVILNKSTLETTMKDVREFISSEDWYRDRGIPYRRGYLLYGQPGNGKSSFVKAIAGEIGYDICIMSLSSRDLDDDTLNDLMNNTYEKCIILIEDVDAAFPSRETQEDAMVDLRSPEGDTSSGRVTLRGLLNALDGVASTEGRIVFLTTNYVDRLDPAMTRPGRVDMKILIDLPDDDQIGRMFSRFYPEASQEDRDTFVKVIRGLTQPVSMAMIQGLFMFHKHSFKNAIDSAVEYFTKQFFSLK